ncbi:MAG: hypothetical protein GY869_02825 [Planctomycetes bacterium]|nr:hypothetical protein [Planctomycetota bacterium]
MTQRAELLVGIVLIGLLIWTPGCSEKPGDTQDPQAKAGDTVDLRLIFVAGQKKYLEERNVSSPTRNVQGREVNTIHSLTRGSTIEIESVANDGSAWLVITHDRIAIEGESVDQQTGKIGRIKFDSKTDPVSSAQGEAKALAALLDLSYRVQLSDQGKVLGFEGLDEMYQDIINNLGLPAGIDTKPLLESMKSMFGETIFKENLEDILAVYPPQPLAVGDTWETQAEFFVGFPVAQARTHTLQEVKKGVVLIDVNATIDSGQKQMMDLMLQQNISEINGSYQETLEIDEQTGWIKTSTTRENFKRKTTAKGDLTNNPANAMVSEVETTITVTISEIK